MQGILLSIEGIDGSGKSSLTTALVKKIEEVPLPVVQTREPGGTPLGQQLRTLLQNQPHPIHPRAEYLLFAADRAQHFATVVLPALTANKIVVSDRMADSSVVYQGFGKGEDIPMITRINAWAMANRMPDITLYLKLTPEQAAERIRKRNQTLTSFEKDETLCTKVAQGFQALLVGKPHVTLLDGMLPTDVLANQAFDVLTLWMKEHQWRP